MVTLKRSCAYRFVHPCRLTSCSGHLLAFPYLVTFLWGSVLRFYQIGAVMKFEARLKRSVLGCGGLKLEIGEPIFGDLRIAYGDSHSFRQVDHFILHGIAVVAWPFHEAANEALAEKVCSLLGVSQVWFVSSAGLTKFGLVHATAVPVA